MPDCPCAKNQPHPFRTLGQRDGSGEARRRSDVAYAELAVTSNYSFLRGASHPEEMVLRAAELGHRAAAIADINTLAGVVRAHVAAKEAGIPLAVGCRIVLADPEGLSVLVYPTNRHAYSRLCRLLTLGKRRAPKGECHLALEDLVEHHEGLLAVVLPPVVVDDRFGRVVRRLLSVFDDDRLSLAAACTYGPDDGGAVRRLAQFARGVRVPLVAINDVHYHIPERRALQDVLTCIRYGCTVEEAGFRLHANAERHLKPAEEMARLFREHPGTVKRAAEIAERGAMFNMDELRYEYPVEPCPEGATPIAYLRELSRAGAEDRYPGGVPEKVRGQLEYELRMIEELHYEAYFLTCYDIVAFARLNGILCQGRGGAANSSVCYCLGITEVDPAKFSLLFERFVSRARNEPPDIDIDFEHERREEVIQYIYRKYGRERAALTAEVITYRGRSAVREVGKAMGLSLDCVDALAKNLDSWHDPPNEKRVREAALNPREPTIAKVLELTSQLVGFPRHLSQHVGGFVITRSDLCDLVPIENAAMDDRTVIEWDKDDIDAMGMLKVDVLGLGMLTCIRKAFELVKSHRGTDLTVAKVVGDRAGDKAVYEAIQHADTVGVFQIESRAQMSMLPRLKPREFYDLVIEVAIVRPGPIQGKMVHPYLRRRNGEEQVFYPTPEIEEVLGRTLGVPLFQEQAMRLAIVAAGFSPDEADSLRRAMAAWKRKGDAIYRFGAKIIKGMVERGYDKEFAERCFEQIKGFSEYGFPESHAASFAILVYVSAWLKVYEPAAFAAALLNSQPMGFYQPAQIVRDAREHRVEVRPVDVNHSQWDCTLESGGGVLRLGMRQVKGLAEADAVRVRGAIVTHGARRTVEDLWRTSGVSTKALRLLAGADAFRSMGLDRQAALWQIKPLRDERLPLFEGVDGTDIVGMDSLPAIGTERQVLQDYDTTGLSLKAHPVSFFRGSLDEVGAIPAADLRNERLCPQGRRVRVAGLVLCRQRPGTASGVVFITLEDESGIVNLVIWKDTFERYRKAARLSTALLVAGRVERQGEVVHVHADRLESLQMPALVSRSRDFH